MNETNNKCDIMIIVVDNMTKLSEMPTESTFDWSSWDGWDDNSTFDLEQPEESQIINYDKLEYLDENNIFFYYKRATTEEDIKKLLTKPEVIKLYRLPS